MVGGSRSSLFGLGLKVGVAEKGPKKQLLIIGKNGSLKTIKMELRWVSSRGKSSTKTPIFISTKPSDVNPEELLRLYAACNHSSHRFPAQDDVVDLHKLRLALSHSSFLVSVFQIRDVRGMLPIPKNSDSDSYSELVGFGRAVSDMGLTASIYDVMVTPSLQRMGIGRSIVKRLLRMIVSRDIYDISALCSENERLFFKACGFGDDMLASTTMMYTKNASTCPDGDQLVKRAGRKLLIVPQNRKFIPSKTKKSWNSSHDTPSLAVVELDID